VRQLLATFLIAAALAISFAPGDAQDSGYNTVILSGTADVLIDSSLTATVMSGKRIHINGIAAHYENAVNTNPIHIQVVYGTSALRVAGAQRLFHFTELMTSGTWETYTFTPNLTSPRDSAIYFVINAAGSDTLNLSVNYKFVN